MGLPKSKSRGFCLAKKKPKCYSCLLPFLPHLSSALVSEIPGDRVHSTGPHIQQTPPRKAVTSPVPPKPWAPALMDPRIHCHVKSQTSTLKSWIKKTLKTKTKDSWRFRLSRKKLTASAWDRDWCHFEMFVRIFIALQVDKKLCQKPEGKSVGSV